MSDIIVYKLGLDVDNKEALKKIDQIQDGITEIDESSIIINFKYNENKKDFQKKVKAVADSNPNLGIQFQYDVNKRALIQAQDKLKEMEDIQIAVDTKGAKQYILDLKHEIRELYKSGADSDLITSKIQKLLNITSVVDESMLAHTKKGLQDIFNSIKGLKDLKPQKIFDLNEISSTREDVKYFEGILKQLRKDGAIDRVDSSDNKKLAELIERVEILEDKLTEVNIKMRDITGKEYEKAAESVKVLKGALEEALQSIKNINNEGIDEARLVEVYNKLSQVIKTNITEAISPEDFKKLGVESGEAYLTGIEESFTRVKETITNILNDTFESVRGIIKENLQTNISSSQSQTDDKKKEKEELARLNEEVRLLKQKRNLIYNPPTGENETKGENSSIEKKIALSDAEAKQDKEREEQGKKAHKERVAEIQKEIEEIQELIVKRQELNNEYENAERGSKEEAAAYDKILEVQKEVLKHIEKIKSLQNQKTRKDGLADNLIHIAEYEGQTLKTIYEDFLSESDQFGEELTNRIEEIENRIEQLQKEVPNVVTKKKNDMDLSDLISGQDKIKKTHTITLRVSPKAEKRLVTQINTIVDNLNKEVHPVEIQVAFVTEYKAKKAAATLKEIAEQLQDQLEESTDEVAKESLSTLLDNVNKVLGNKLNLEITVDGSNKAEQLVKNLRKKLEKEFPAINIQAKFNKTTLKSLAKQLNEIDWSPIKVASLKRMLIDDEEVKEIRKEISPLEILKNYILSIKKAINDKTDAFKDEATKVKEYTEKEISYLTPLLEAFTNIRDVLDEIKQLSLSIGDIKFTFDSESLKQMVAASSTISNIIQNGGGNPNTGSNSDSNTNSSPSAKKDTKEEDKNTDAKKENTKTTKENTKETQKETQAIREKTEQQETETDKTVTSYKKKETAIKAFNASYEKVIENFKVIENKDSSKREVRRANNSNRMYFGRIPLLATITSSQDNNHDQLLEQYLKSLEGTWDTTTKKAEEAKEAVSEVRTELKETAQTATETEDKLSQTIEAYRQIAIRSLDAIKKEEDIKEAVSDYLAYKRLGGTESIKDLLLDDDDDELLSSLTAEIERQTKAIEERKKAIEASREQAKADASEQKEEYVFEDVTDVNQFPKEVQKLIEQHSKVLKKIEEILAKKEAETYDKLTQKQKDKIIHDYGVQENKRKEIEKKIHDNGTGYWFNDETNQWAQSVRTKKVKKPYGPMDESKRLTKEKITALKDIKEIEDAIKLGQTEFDEFVEHVESIGGLHLVSKEELIRYYELQTLLTKLKEKRDELVSGPKPKIVSEEELQTLSKQLDRMDETFVTKGFDTTSLKNIYAEALKMSDSISKRMNEGEQGLEKTWERIQIIIKDSKESLEKKGLTLNGNEWIESQNTEKQAKAQKEVNENAEETSKFVGKTREELEKCLAAEKRWQGQCKPGSDKYKERQKNIEEINALLSSSTPLDKNNLLSGTTTLPSTLKDTQKELKEVGQATDETKSKFREYCEEVALGLERIARAKILEKAGLMDGQAFDPENLGDGTARLGKAYKLVSASNSLYEGILKKGLLKEGSQNFKEIGNVIEDYIKGFLSHFNITVNEIKEQLSEIPKFDPKDVGFKPHRKNNEKGDWQHYHSIDKNGHSTDKFEGDYTYKTYARFADPRNLNQANIIAIMKALSSAGFKGQLKVPGTGGTDTVITSSDQLVVHGINSKMQQLAYEILRKDFGDLFSSLKAGFDKTKTSELNGASFSEIAINKGRDKLIEQSRELLRAQQAETEAEQENIKVVKKQEQAQQKLADSKKEASQQSNDASGLSNDADQAGKKLQEAGQQGETAGEHISKGMLEARRGIEGTATQLKELEELFNSLSNSREKWEKDLAKISYDHIIKQFKNKEPLSGYQHSKIFIEDIFKQIDLLKSDEQDAYILNTHEFGMSEDQLIELFKKEQEEIEKGNIKFRERLVLLKEGKVISSSMGDYAQIPSTEIAMHEGEYDKILHTHPIAGGNPNINSPSYPDIKMFFDQIRKGAQEFELYWNNHILKIKLPEQLTGKKMSELREGWEEFEQIQKSAYEKFGNNPLGQALLDIVGLTKFTEIFGTLGVSIENVTLQEKEFDETQKSVKKTTDEVNQEEEKETTQSVARFKVKKNAVEKFKKEYESYVALLKQYNELEGKKDKDSQRKSIEDKLSAKIKKMPELKGVDLDEENNYNKILNAFLKSQNPNWSSKSGLKKVTEENSKETKENTKNIEKESKALDENTENTKKNTKAKQEATTVTQKPLNTSSEEEVAEDFKELRKAIDSVTDIANMPIVDLGKVYKTDSLEELAIMYETILQLNNDLWKVINSGQGSNTLKSYADKLGFSLTKIEEKMMTEGWMRDDKSWKNLFGNSQIMPKPQKDFLKTFLNGNISTKFFETVFGKAEETITNATGTVNNELKETGKQADSTSEEVSGAVRKTKEAAKEFVAQLVSDYGDIDKLLRYFLEANHMKSKSYETDLQLLLSDENEVLRRSHGKTAKKGEIASTSVGGFDNVYMDMHVHPGLSGTPSFSMPRYESGQLFGGDITAYNKLKEAGTKFASIINGAGDVRFFDIIKMFEAINSLSNGKIDLSNIETIKKLASMRFDPKLIDNDELYSIWEKSGVYEEWKQSLISYIKDNFKMPQKLIEEVEKAITNIDFDTFRKDTEVKGDPKQTNENVKNLTGLFQKYIENATDLSLDGLENFNYKRSPKVRAKMVDFWVQSAEQHHSQIFQDLGAAGFNASDYASTFKLSDIISSLRELSDKYKKPEIEIDATNLEEVNNKIKTVLDQLEEYKDLIRSIGESNISLNDWIKIDDLRNELKQLLSIKKEIIEANPLSEYEQLIEKRNSIIYKKETTKKALKWAQEDNDSAAIERLIAQEKNLARELDQLNAKITLLEKTKQAQKELNEEEKKSDASNQVKTEDKVEQEATEKSVARFKVKKNAVEKFKKEYEAYISLLKQYNELEGKTDKADQRKSIEDKLSAKIKKMPELKKVDLSDENNYNKVLNSFLQSQNPNWSSKAGLKAASKENAEATKENTENIEKESKALDKNTKKTKENTKAKQEINKAQNESSASSNRQNQDNQTSKQDSSKTQEQVKNSEIRVKQYLTEKNAIEGFTDAYEKYFTLREKKGSSNEKTKNKATQDMEKLLTQFPTLKSIGRKKKENVNFDEQLKSFMATQTDIRRTTKEVEKQKEAINDNTQALAKQEKQAIKTEEAVKESSKPENKKQTSRTQDPEVKKEEKQVTAESLNGMKEGILEAKEELLDVARETALDCLKEVKKVLDIKSPSGEFKKVGIAIIDGIIEGIKERTPQLKANLKDAMLESLKLGEDLAKGQPIDALTELASAKNTFEPFFNDAEKLNTKEGQEAALSYYKAFKRALDEKVNKKDLDANLLGQKLFKGNYTNYKKGTGVLDTAVLDQAIADTSKNIELLSSPTDIANLNALTESLTKLGSTSEGTEKLTNCLKALVNVFSVLGGNNADKKVEQINKSMSGLKTALSGMDIKKSGLLTQLDAVLSRGEELKALANIIKNDKAVVKNAQKQADRKAEKAARQGQAEEYYAKNNNAIEQSFNELVEKNNWKVITSQMQPFEDGLVHIKALIEEIGASGEKLHKIVTYTTSDGNDLKQIESRTDLVSITKKVMAYERLQKALARIVPDAEDIGHVEPGTAEWEHLVDLMTQFGIEATDVVKVIRQIDDMGHESFEVFDSAGNRTTIGASSTDILGLKETLLDVDKIQKQLNNDVSVFGTALKRGLSIGELQTTDFINRLYEMQSLIEQLRFLKGTGNTKAADALSATLERYKASIKDFGNYLDLSKYTKLRMSPDTKKIYDELKASATDVKNVFDKLSNSQPITAQDIDLLETYIKDTNILNNELKQRSGLMASEASVNKEIKKAWKNALDNTANKELSKQFRMLAAEMEHVRDTYNGMMPNDQLDSFKARIQQLSAELEKSGQKGKSWGQMIVSSLKSANARFIANYLSIQDMIRYGRTAFNTVLQLDTALIDLKKTTTMNNTDLEKFYQNSSKLAKQMGVTTQEIIEQASAWSRLGFSSKEQAETMSLLSSKFASISPGMSTEEAQTGLVSLIKAWDIDVKDVERELMDNINTLGNKFALSNKDIIDGMERAGATLSVIGTSVQDSFALFTGAQEVIQNAETVGTALKTLSLRIRGYDEETEELSDDVIEATGKIADLTKVASNNFSGVSLWADAAQTQYRSLKDYLGDIAEIWDEIDARSQTKLLEGLFGKRGASVGSSILQNFDQVEKAIEEMEGAAGSADKEMDTIRASLEYKINALKETWTGIFQNLIDRGTFGGVIDFLTTLSELIKDITSNSDALAFTLTTIVSAFAQFKGGFNSIDWLKSIGEFFVGKGKESIVDLKSMMLFDNSSITEGINLDNINDQINTLEKEITGRAKKIGETLSQEMKNGFVDNPLSAEESAEWFNLSATTDEIQKKIEKLRAENIEDTNTLQTLEEEKAALEERMILEVGVRDAVNERDIAENQINQTLMQEAMSERNLSIEEKDLLVSESQRLAVLAAENSEAAKAIMENNNLTAKEKEQQLAILKETAARYSLTEARMADVAQMIREKIARNDNVTQTEREILATYEHIGALKQEQQQSALTAKALTLLKSVGSMLITSAIMYGVSKIVELFNDWTHASEKAAEAAKKARDEIDNLQKSFKDLKKTTDGIKDRFAELAQGVKNIGTAFQSQGTLSNDEYKEFLDMSNQLAELYPQLTKGYDDNGQAILDLSDNVNTIVGSLNQLIEAEKEAANIEIWKKSDEIWEGLKLETKNIENEITHYKGLIQDLELSFESIKRKEKVFASETDDKGLVQVNFEKMLERAGLDSDKIINRIGYWDNTRGYIYDFNLLFDEEIEALRKASEQLSFEYKKQQDNLKQNITSQFSDTHDIIFSWLETQSEDYEKIGAIYGKDGQKIIQELLNNIDPDILISNIKNMSKDEFIGWLDSMYLQPLMELSKEGQDIVIQGMTADGNRAELLQQYQEIIDYLMAQPGFSPDNPLYVYFTDKIVGISNDINAAYDKIVGDTNLQDKPKEVVRDWIKELSDEDYNLVMNANVDPTGYSKESLDKWLANLQRYANANPIDVSISGSIKQLAKQMDPYFDEIGNFYQKIFADGYNSLDKSVLDNDTLNSLRSTFEEIADDVGVAFDPTIIDNFWHELEDAPNAEAAHDAINTLATEWLDATDTIKSINDDTAQYIQTQLENWGVRNADAVVQSRLRYNNANKEAAQINLELIPLYDQLIDAQRELNNASEEEQAAASAKIANIQKEINKRYEQAAADEFVQLALFKLQLQENNIDLDNIDSSKDVAAILEIAQACGYTSAALSALQKFEANIGSLIGVPTDAINGMRQAYINQFVESMDPAKLLEAAELQIPNTNSGGSGDDAVSEFEKALEILDKLRDNDVIDTKHYLDQKRLLIEKFYKNGILSAEEYFEKIHAWLREMLDLYNSVISDVTKILQKQIDSLEKERDKKIKEIEKARDAEIKSIDDQIEAIDKKIKKKNEEIEAMEKEHEARKQNMDLMRAEYELQRSLHQRVNLVYKEGADGKGQMVYQADPKAIQDAQEQVDEQRYQKQLKILQDELEIYEKQKESLEEKKQSIEEYYQKMIDETNEYYDNAIQKIQDYIDLWEELSEVEERLLMEDRLASLGLSMDDILNLDMGSFELFKTNYLGLLDDIYSRNEGMNNLINENFGEVSGYLNSTSTAMQTLEGINLESLTTALDSVDKSTQSIRDCADPMQSNLSNAFTASHAALIPLNETISELQGILTDINGQTYTVKVRADVDLSALKNLPKGATIDFSGGGTSSGQSEFNGTVGAAFFDGYPGLTKPEQDAIRSEFGQPELTVYPDGTYEITTTPTISDLPKGTVIFNEEQTKRILKNNGKGGKAFATGTTPSISPLKDAMPEKFAMMEQLQNALKDNLDKMSYDIASISSNVRNIATNITNVRNDSGNTMTINGGINVTCPGVTEAEVAKNIGGALREQLNGMFTGFALKADQLAMRR